MAEAVQVVFQIDQPGTAAAKLKSLDQLLLDIGVSANAAGQKLDKQLVASFAKMSPGALQAINAELLKMAPAANQAAAAMSKIAPGGGSQLGPRSFGQRAQDLDFERVMNRGDAAGRKLAGTLGEVSANAGKGAANLNKAQNALIAMSGIPGGQMIGSVMGLLSLGPVGLLLGGIALGLTKIHSIFTGIREEAEANLKAVEQWNNLGKMGMRGGTEQTKEDFEKLTGAVAEMKRLGQLGMTQEMAEISEKMMGRKGVTLQTMEASLALAKSRADSLGIDTRDPLAVQRLKDAEELKQKRIRDYNEMNSLRLDGQIAEMDHAAKLRTQALSLQTELAKKKLDAFQLDMAHAVKLGSIFDEQEKLRAGLGGADLRSKAEGIDAQGTILKRAINDAMMSGHEFGPGGRRDLLSQYSKLGMTAPGERLGAESMERGIKLGQDKLLAAGDNLQARASALDQIISSSANIGSLTSDQVDARMKALTEKSGVEQELRAQDAQEAAAYHKQTTKDLADIKALLGARNEQGVKITLRDESGGSLKTELGTAPTPESSGAVSSGLTQSSAFRNDPMSGRL